eukprot:TRINITY_DN3400_c0_g1_i3.p1 TRINITY_DN3400_c0_g1~~TRINITY_DN3400_c0_g1_i3.p1  ORF type:complete len:650 (-),score=134.66 TRINITY_DN3400_c0_g1_i3:731-2527(-)
MMKFIEDFNLLGDDYDIDNDLFMLIVDRFLALGPINTFHQIQVHSAMTIAQLSQKINEMNESGKELENLGVSIQAVHGKYMIISPMIFLDEGNTMSAPGLMNELMINRSINGTPLHKNILVATAINLPRQFGDYRSNSGVVRDEIESGNSFLGHYNVRVLPSSIRQIVWDFRSMSKEDEKEYTLGRIKICDDLKKAREKYGNKVLAEVLVNCQNILRAFAVNELKSKCPTHIPQSEWDKDATVRAESRVSQRDIQRVFTLLPFCLKLLDASKDGHYRHGNRNVVSSSFSCADELDAFWLAVLCSYYLRLFASERTKLLAILNTKFRQLISSNSYLLNLLKKRCMEFLKSSLDFKSGVAKTDALMENCLATIAGVLSGVAISLVGRPGSSKTTAVVDGLMQNLRGSLSKHWFWRQYPHMDVRHFQCGQNTGGDMLRVQLQGLTDSQIRLNECGAKKKHVLLLDDTNLLNEKQDSLKVIHYFAEHPQIGLVLNTNDIPDAAIVNRTLCVFREPCTLSELKLFALKIFESDRQYNLQSGLQEKLHQMCETYFNLMHPNNKELRITIFLVFNHNCLSLHLTQRLKIYSHLILQMNRIVKEHV